MIITAAISEDASMRASVLILMLTDETSFVHTIYLYHRKHVGVR